MKLKTIKKRNNELIKLNIVKLKLYKKKQQFNLKFNTKQIELNLKKILQIIYQYHMADKKILFLEFPKTFSHILKKTKHTLVPESILYNGFISNRNFDINQHNLTEKQTKIPFNIIKTLLKLKNKISLIIVYNYNRNHESTLKESYHSTTPPIISIFSKTDPLSDNKITYKIFNSSGCIEEKIANNHLLVTMIKSVFQKAIRHNK